MKRRGKGVKAVLLIAVMFFGLFAGTQPVAADERVTCASPSELGPGAPVVMVHGLNSRPDAWDRMLPVVKGIKDIYLTEPFDYEKVHNEWVTNDEIGPKLAKRIDCLSQASLKGGGKGKVIVVAHSMGALAARFAANQTVDGRKVSGELGLVATAGAPNLGSGLGNWCNIIGFVQDCQGSAPEAMAIGSDQLRDLPRFPANVLVRAIAGQVVVHTRFGFGYIDQDREGDLVVSVDSATDGYTDTGQGDGKVIVKCFGDNAINGQSHAPCEHGNLLNNDTVQQLVKQGIERYIASLNPPKSSPSKVLPVGPTRTLFNKLIIPSPGAWSGATGGPDAVENFVDSTNCAGGAVFECPLVSFVDLDTDYARTAYVGDPVKAAATSCSLEQDENGHKPYELPKLKGTIQIDGQSAEYYEQTVCPPYFPKQTAYIWYIKTRKILVTASDVPDHKVAAATLGKVLRDAVWK